MSAATGRLDAPQIVLSSTSMVARKTYTVCSPVFTTLHTQRHTHTHCNALSSPQMKILVPQRFLDMFPITPTIVETAGTLATVCKSPSDLNRLHSHLTHAHLRTRD